MKKKQLQAEAHVLERVMYLLEEKSVLQLMQEDGEFAHYIRELYSSLDAKTAALQPQV